MRTHLPHRHLIAAALAIAALTCSTAVVAQSPAIELPALQAADLVYLLQTPGGDAALDNAWQAACGKQGRVIAFEEHRHFVYLAAKAPCRTADDADPCEVLRRIVVLKPDVLVVQDTIALDAGEHVVACQVVAQLAAEQDGQIRLTHDGPPLWLQVTTSPREEVAIDQSDDGARVALTTTIDNRQAATLQWVRVFRSSNANVPPGTALKHMITDGAVDATIATAQHTCRLLLPPCPHQGEIALTAADGANALPQRLLPAGVLPQGPQLLERWDRSYRDGRRPGWDVGRPSRHLVEAIEKGTLKPGRAVVLGCGTGTNAIYLAEHGFDVTGVDIAPTALIRAKAKAAEAGVQSQWLLADVTAVPSLEPFDVVFDRGCYHGVRRGNAAGYVASLAKITKPGSRALILAGNANEPKPHYGPPRVTEAQIRADFAKQFELAELRQIHFDTGNAEGQGPWAWAIVLVRK